MHRTRLALIPRNLRLIQRNVASHSQSKAAQSKPAAPDTVLNANSALNTNFARDPRSPSTSPTPTRSTSTPPTPPSSRRWSTTCPPRRPCPRRRSARRRLRRARHAALCRRRLQVLPPARGQLPARQGLHHRPHRRRPRDDRRRHRRPSLLAGRQGKRRAPRPARRSAHHRPRRRQGPPPDRPVLSRSTTSPAPSTPPKPARPPR